MHDSETAQAVAGSDSKVRFLQTVWFKRAAKYAVISAFAVCTAVGAARAASLVEVTTDILMLRVTPSVEADALMTLQAGERAELIEEIDGFYRVTVKGKEGYLNAKYSQAIDAPQLASRSGGFSVYEPAKPAPGLNNTQVSLKKGDSSDDVKDMQYALTIKGYLQSEITGNFGEESLQALINFQTKNGLDASGIADEYTLKALYGKRSDRPADKVLDFSEYMEAEEDPPEVTAAPLTDGEKAVNGSGETGHPDGKIEPSIVNGQVKLVDWWSEEVRVKAFPRGTVATVIDAETGRSFQVRRKGGSNHADCEPLTAEDTAIMYELRNNQWGWSARSVYLVVDGVYYAAAINGMPHGKEDIGSENNFTGHFCMHFLNSRTHKSNKKNVDMQEKLLDAYESARTNIQ